MADEKSKLLTKVSPLIEGQVPDFIQADHPIFVKFLKEYYKFLEAGQVTYDVVNSYVRFETTTVAYVLNEKDAGDSSNPKLAVGHVDNERDMIRRQLYQMGKYTVELAKMLKDLPDSDFPNWWQSKITKAGLYIQRCQTLFRK